MGLTERLSILIDAHAGGAIAEFKKVQGATAGLNASVTGSTKQLGGLGQAGAAAGGMLKAGLAAGAVAAGGAIVSFGVSSVKAFNDLAQEVLKFQRASGATAEESSALIAAFDDMGIQAETGSKAIFQLGKRLETSADALSKYGITAVKNAAGNTDMAATLKSVADAYVNTTDPAERAALVAAAFGKAGQDLIPILEKGSAGIEAFYAGAAATGQILSQEDIDKAEEFRIAMDDLSDAVRRLSLEFGKSLTPFLTDLANAITKAVELSDKITTLNGLIDEKPSGTGGAGQWLDSLKNQILGIKPPAKEASKAIAEIPKTLVEDKDAIAEFDKEVDALSKTLFSAATASRALADAEESLRDAHQTLSDATADYNQLLKDGAVDEEKVADARQSLAAATRSLGSAHRAQRKAQEEYNDALAAAKLLGTDTNSDKLADAADNLADADDGVTTALEAQAAAAADLAKAKAGDPDYQQKLADAKERVGDATQGIADAEYDLGKRSYENVTAHNAERDAISEKADQVVRLKAELEAMLKLNPAMFPFLGPLLAALPAGAAPKPSQIPLPPGIAGPVLPAFPGANTLLAGPSAPVTTTNNVTVNATTSEADARLIAKEVMWNLN